MTELRYTLLTDGSSDRLLLPLLDWLLRRRSCRLFHGVWADLGRLPRPPRGLAERIKTAIDFYPCELLFVHRDAEGDLHPSRVQEIESTLRVVGGCPAVCVVPVRMQEAWFLFDEMALRRAAGNPSGFEQLNLPEVSDVENVLDAKRVLHEALRSASGLRGRRLKKFPVHARAHRLATLIDDFTPLCSVPAFRALEHELGMVIDANGWR